MIRTYIGIDNGVTGSIGIIITTSRIVDNVFTFQTPIYQQPYYTKKEKTVTRININAMNIMLKNIAGKMNPIAILERPKVTPQRFYQSLSAIRSHEATLIALEQLNIELYRHGCIDSREWQKIILPGIHGKELKEKSLEVGLRLFPNINIGSLKDLDGLLIAEWARRKEL